MEDNSVIPTEIIQNDNPQRLVSQLKLGNNSLFKVYIDTGSNRESTTRARIRTMTQVENKYGDWLYGFFEGLQHKNILKMLKSFTDNDNIHTISEFEEYTLWDVRYDTHSNNFFDTDDIVGNFLLQIADGVKFLHDRLIFHSYINCKTIYVKNCSLIKLGGFYFCERLNSADSKIDILENRKRRIEYDVPNGLYIGLEYDMWCIGCVLYEMLFKEKPSLNIDRSHTENIPEPYRTDLKIPFKKLLVNKANCYNIDYLLDDLKPYILARDARSDVQSMIDRGEWIRGRYIPEELLGINNNGYTIKVKDEQRNREYKVIKSINCDAIHAVDTRRNAIINDYIARFDSQNPNSINVHVVRFDSHFIDSNRLFLVTEYCNGGNLGSFISKYRQQKKEIPDNILSDIIYQLIKGISMIHSQAIIHRKINPRNILLQKHDPESEEIILKYGDFDLAKMTEEIGDTFTTYVGTSIYAAPEIHLRNLTFTKSMDIWSLGCIIYELITLKPLFQSESVLVQQIQHEPDVELVDRYLINVPHQYSKLLSLMILRNPENRASADVLLRLIRPPPGMN